MNEQKIFSNVLIFSHLFLALVAPSQAFHTTDLQRKSQHDVEIRNHSFIYVGDTLVHDFISHLA